MKTADICLTIYEWNAVLDELANAGVSFYEIYGQVEDLVFGYPDSEDNYEWLTIEASEEAFDELRDIFEDLGFLVQF